MARSPGQRIAFKPLFEGLPQKRQHGRPAAGQTASKFSAEEVRAIKAASIALWPAGEDVAAIEAGRLRDAKGLTQGQINAAFGDAETELPDGLTPPAHWLASGG